MQESPPPKKKKNLFSFPKHLLISCSYVLNGGNLWNFIPSMLICLLVWCLQTLCRHESCWEFMSAKYHQSSFEAGRGYYYRDSQMVKMQRISGYWMPSHQISSITESLDLRLREHKWRTRKILRAQGQGWLLWDCVHSCLV